LGFHAIAAWPTPTKDTSPEKYSVPQPLQPCLASKAAEGIKTFVQQTFGTAEVFSFAAKGNQVNWDAFVESFRISRIERCIKAAGNCGLAPAVHH
jgi:hypothetical protein